MIVWFFQYQTQNVSLSERGREAQTGVIAQQVQQVIPEAVSTSGSYMLANGREINDMLIVNKDRLFLGKNRRTVFN